MSAHSCVSAQTGKESEFRRDWKRNRDENTNFHCALKVNMCSSHLFHSRTVLVALEWNRENQHRGYGLTSTEGNTEEEIFRVVLTL